MTSRGPTGALALSADAFAHLIPWLVCSLIGGAGSIFIGSRELLAGVIFGLIALAILSIGVLKTRKQVKLTEKYVSNLDEHFSQIF